jgi:hypothetical protein
MKSTLLTLAILALITVPAFGQTGDGRSDNSAVIADNIESIVETLKTNALPKSEFETTEKYEARRQTARKGGATFKFVLDAAAKTFTYDADSRMTQVSVPVEDHIFLGQNPPKRPVINVHFVKRSERKYTGSNAFGAQAEVTSTTTDFYGVLLSQPIESPLLFPMEAVAAQSVKPFLRIGFVCTLTGNNVVEDTFVNTAKIDFPYDIYQHYKYVPVLITEIFVVDNRDGKVLMQVQTGLAADMTAQKDMRNKLFPITLEIRGLGAVYLSIDGETEQMVQPGFLNETVMFRAKHQIHLRLSTRYDPLQFQLNGVRYKPKWVMNRSGIVEQPEAVISAEQAVQVGTNAKTKHKN